MSDDDLKCWLREDLAPPLHDALVELQQLRAARAADAERVRSVVREAVHAAWPESKFGGNAPDAIAARVAEQLAGAVVGLSEDDVYTLTWMRQRLELYLEEGQTTKHALTNTERATTAIALLDRLLASPPEPTLTRVALIEAFVAGAEYVQDHWYVGEQLSIELDDGADIERAAGQHASLMKPAPDHTAAICALLDSDMPAGDLRKALAELVGRR